MPRSLLYRILFNTGEYPPFTPRQRRLLVISFILGYAVSSLTH